MFCLNNILGYQKDTSFSGCIQSQHKDAHLLVAKDLWQKFAHLAGRLPTELAPEWNKSTVNH